MENGEVNLAVCWMALIPRRVEISRMTRVTKKSISSTLLGVIFFFVAMGPSGAVLME